MKNLISKMDILIYIIIGIAAIIVAGAWDKSATHFFGNHPDTSTDFSHQKKMISNHSITLEPGSNIKNS